MVDTEERACQRHIPGALPPSYEPIHLEHTKPNEHIVHEACTTVMTRWCTVGPQNALSPIPATLRTNTMPLPQSRYNMLSEARSWHSLHRA